eukprot:CAMPEP_0184560772 /NCGR_PEP_ID=MMETSP0199_2-20130426/47103_1 /TAXON_ID=1112570 /ORGANISM="Thraustochytrium sp., Strain LLF1b" /LENGTH=738 /DNA_ID=CAMNT_0026958079 /DNA_START=448 /DNA_END=2660 /DNA_ORIENTATION=+
MPAVRFELDPEEDHEESRDYDFLCGDGHLTDLNKSSGPIGMSKEQRSSSPPPPPPPPPLPLDTSQTSAPLSNSRPNLDKNKLSGSAAQEGALSASSLSKASNQSQSAQAKPKHPFLKKGSRKWTQVQPRYKPLQATTMTSNDDCKSSCQSPINDNKIDQAKSAKGLLASMQSSASQSFSSSASSEPDFDQDFLQLSQYPMQQSRKEEMNLQPQESHPKSERYQLRRPLTETGNSSFRSDDDGVNEEYLGESLTRKKALVATNGPGQPPARVPVGVSHLVHKMFRTLDPAKTDEGSFDTETTTDESIEYVATAQVQNASEMPTSSFDSSAHTLRYAQDHQEKGQMPRGKSKSAPKSNHQSNGKSDSVTSARLEEEMRKFEVANEKLNVALERVQADRRQLEQDRRALDRERTEREKGESQVVREMREQVQRERAQIHRERSALEKSKQHIELMRASAKLDKQDKAQVESLQATIAQLRLADRERANKHRDALRAKSERIVALEQQVRQLNEALKFAEERRLDLWEKQCKTQIQFDELQAQNTLLQQQVAREYASKGSAPLTPPSGMKTPKESSSCDPLEHSSVEEVAERTTLVVEEDQSDEQLPAIPKHGHQQAAVERGAAAFLGKNQKRQVIVHDDGTREVLYSNGSRKEKLPSGEVTITFPSGDIKKVIPEEGIEIYYFAESDTTQTKYHDGVIVLKFPNGQVERTLTDKTLQVFYPDGTVKVVGPDGTEETVFSDG